MNLRVWNTLALCSALLAASILGGFTPAQDGDKKDKPAKKEIVEDARVGGTLVKGQLLVTLHHGVKEAELKPIFERLDVKFEILRRIASLNHYTIAVDHERLPEIRQRLANHPFVATATVNAVVKLQQVPGLKKPGFNDPVFKKPDDMLEDKDNWNLYRIKANEAWDITTGGALIAIVDSGARLEHEELVGRTTNPLTYALNPDFQGGMKKGRAADGTQYDFEVRDHGTHVAITAAGAANNGVGTAGVAPSSPLMPIQVLYYTPNTPADGTGEVLGNNDEIIAGLERAITSGAAVVNMSLGSNLSPDLLKRWRDAPTPQARLDVEREILPGVQKQVAAYSRAFDLANQRGTIIVVSAGNQNMPAHLYALPLSQRVISVAAMTREDKRWNDPDFGSNYGPYTTVSAPGKEVYSGNARGDKSYDSKRGTSMAAPHVTGVVALMKTLDPELKLADVVDILVKTGRPLDTDVPIGPLVNAKAALDEVKRRQANRVPRQPDPPPLIAPPIENPTIPELPPDPIDILTLPDPWNNANVQRIIQVWLSFAVAPTPPGGDPQGVWVFNRYGQVVNINVNINVNNQRPIWSRFTYRWLWENSLTLTSTNMGSLYEFLVGTLRQGRFNPAPPRVRVPENVRPRPTDPRPRVGGLRFDPTLNNTKWTGKNGKGETIEFAFTTGKVVIVRGGKTTNYTVRINTYLTPTTIDFYPDGGGDPALGLLQMTELGELLLRTDFTKKRPPTISRGDPLTFVLRRTDVVLTSPGATDDGVQLPLLFKGTETLFASLEPHKKIDPKTAWNWTGTYYVHNYALSGDGQRVWLMLFSSAEAHKAEPWQLWSMRTDGTDVKQSPFERPKGGTNRPSTVFTNGDGSVAWIMSLPYWIHLQQVTPGGTAKVVVAELKEDYNPNTTLSPRVSADGKKLIFLGGDGIIEVRADGHHKYLQKTKELVYKGMHPHSKFWSLAIDAKGEHWATVASFLPPKAKKVIEVVVKGSASGPPQFHEEKETISHVAMSEDGQSVVIQRRLQKTPNVHLWRDGRVKPILPDSLDFREVVLSGDGKTMYAENMHLGQGLDGPGMLEDLTTGQRRRAMSREVPGSPNYERVRLSRDGKLLVSEGMRGGNAQHGLYVFRADAAPPATYPQIKSVRQRYDGGTLVITVEVSSPELLGDIAIHGHKNGYLPPRGLVPDVQNPFLHINYSRFAAVPKRPGVYQHTIDIGTRHAFLDGTYSFRIVAVNAERTRATFQEYAVLR